MSVMCDDSRDVRTSQGTFMSRHDDPEGVISWIEEKAAQLTGLPVSHGEVGHLAMHSSALQSRLDYACTLHRAVLRDPCVLHGTLTYRGGLKAILCSVQPFNVLRYQLGQHYDSHYDIFEPESYGPQSSQRVRSVLHWCITCLAFPAVLARMLAPMSVLSPLCPYRSGHFNPCLDWS